MTVYNSSVGSNQDDTNLTMIDESYLYDNNDQPISNSVLRHLQQANHPTKNSDNKNDYIYVEHDRLELAEQIERILKFYQQDLKQDSNTLLDCNQQLIIRLVDLIRPIYSSKRNKLKDLDALIEDISVLQALPFIEQKEKTEQLSNEILHLKKLIITSANEGDRSDNTMTKVYRINSMVNYEHWREMEEETRKLHNLVETQRDRINELINLIAQEDEVPVDKKQPTENTSVIPKTRASTDQPKASGTNKLQNKTDEFDSPGTSPIHSLTDFLTEPFVDTVDNETQNEERPIISVRTLPPLSRLSSYADIKKCPICSHEFRRATDELEIYIHVEACLTSPVSGNNDPTETNVYECPNCKQRFPDDDKVYLEHLTDCYNERYNYNSTVPSIKQNDFLQLIRTCPLCQAIFNVLTIDEQQFQEHIKAHSHQKPR